jgi:YtcA-like protein
MISKPMTLKPMISRPMTSKPICTRHWFFLLALLTPLLLASSGCSRSPSFSVLGSFFPAWILCVVLGIVLTFLLHLPLRRWRIEPHMRPLVIVYPCIAATFCCTLWLLFFS